MDVRVLVGARPEGREGPPLVYGYVSFEKSPPASFTDPLWVVIPSRSSEIAVEFPQWPRIHGNTLPQAGTVCLVGYDERAPGVPYLVTWVGLNTPIPPYS